MSAFRYEAIDPTGRTLKGVLEADSARAGRSHLRTQGLTPLIVELAAQPARRTSSAPVARPQAVAARAGDHHAPAREPARRGAAARRIAVGVERTGRARLRARADGVDPRGSRRRPFVRERAEPASARFPGDLSRARRGRRAPASSASCSRLADYIEQSNALKQKILLAFTYPGIVTLIAFGIVTFLLSYVVPQVANVFTSTKLQLPTLTVVMLALSDFVRHWWWASFAAAAVLVYAIRKVLSRDAPRLRFDTWLLTAPLAGKLVRGYNTVRFASTLGILTAAGVPILRALQAARRCRTVRCARTSTTRSSACANRRCHARWRIRRRFRRYSCT